MSKTQLLSFHGKESTKRKYLARLRNHRRMEQLVQGRTGEDNGDGWKGCAVACTLDKYDHAAYETELGLPEWLARLEDHIFENLPKGEAEQFAEDFLSAIPVGKNVEPVRHRLAILRQEAALERLTGNEEPYADECRNALNLVITYHNSCLHGGDTESARSAAWSAAESAAWSAESAAWSAESAARSAESAAWSAARSAASAARSAESAARSAAWSAAGSAYYKWEAATLLRLLSET